MSTQTLDAHHLACKCLLLSHTRQGHNCMLCCVKVVLGQPLHCTRTYWPHLTRLAGGALFVACRKAFNRPATGWTTLVVLASKVQGALKGISLRWCVAADDTSQL